MNFPEDPNISTPDFRAIVKALNSKLRADSSSHVIQMKPPVDESSSAEQLWLAFQNVRDRVRDLNGALTTLGDQLRAAKAQDRTIKAELANASGVLAKLQSIAI